MDLANSYQSYRASQTWQELTRAIWADFHVSVMGSQKLKALPKWMNQIELKSIFFFFTKMRGVLMIVETSFLVFYYLLTQPILTWKSAHNQMARFGLTQSNPGYTTGQASGPGSSFVYVFYLIFFLNK